MSGHEKWYIPHDDLVSLEEAIESLETNIETLDDTINLLIEKLALPSETHQLTFTHTTENDDEYFTFTAQTPSATKATYMNRLTVNLTTEVQDPLLGRDSDLFIGFTDEDGTVIIRDNVIGLQNQFANYGDTIWIFSKNYDLQQQKVSADKALQGVGYACNLKAGVVITIHITYIEEYQT